MYKLRMTMALAAMLATGGALAENISLRFTFSQGRDGTVFTPIQAETGNFAVTPNVPGEGRPWRVVARDAQGRVLHEAAVRGAASRHVETFNPKNGAIDISTNVKQDLGVFEVSLPYDANTASVEVLPSGQGNANALAAAAPMARFDRASIDRVLKSSTTQRSLAPAPAATATTILETGPSANRMDYVFVGDGYTAAEMDKWHSDAQAVINGFLADPLFAANRGSMNIRRVDVASKQSGVDEPDLGIYKDTAMDGSFYCYNIDRLLCVDNTKVYNIVGSVLPPDQRDVIVVISNSTRYGGSGGAVAALSMHASSIEIALHEIGHTAFSLADEYEYGSCSLASEPTEPDVSLNGTRSVKWGALISPSTAVPTGLGAYPNGTVGTFVGAQYCGSGKYRPTENSRMRTLGYPWHAVNEGAARSVFARYTTIRQTGTLTSGALAYAPSASPGYVQAGAGVIDLKLAGPAGADFDLALYKSSGGAWVKVASSTSSGPNESISYNGTAGYYYVEVKAYSGSGAYTLDYLFPPK